MSASHEIPKQQHSGEVETHVQLHPRGKKNIQEKQLLASAPTERNQRRKVTLQHNSVHEEKPSIPETRASQRQHTPILVIPTHQPERKKHAGRFQGRASQNASKRIKKTQQSQPLFMNVHSGICPGKTTPPTNERTQGSGGRNPEIHEA